MFRYPGGKSKVKTQIYDVLARHRSQMSPDAELREPFLGGGAITIYCLQKRLTNRVWFNDFDPGIASIWESALNTPEQLINKILAYTPSVDDFWRFKANLTNDEFLTSTDKLTIAFQKIVVHQFSYSGLGLKAGSPIGGKTQVDESGAKKKYAFDCRWSPKKIIKDINEFQRITKDATVRGNTCTSLDYRELIVAPEEALIYLDPPYYEQGEALYQFFFTEEQHEEMARLLKATPHRWVLSYDNHPRIRELYSWANIQDLDIQYSITAANQPKELIITN